MINISNSLHIVPINDLIEHNTDSDECFCDPVLYKSDGERTIVKHNSFDGREQNERSTRMEL